MADRIVKGDYGELRLSDTAKKGKVVLTVRPRVPRP
jgi:hypothetical protein